MFVPNFNCLGLVETDKILTETNRQFEKKEKVDR